MSNKSLILDADQQALWSQFQDAVARTDQYIESHQGCVEAGRTDAGRIGFERCIELTRITAQLWKTAYLADDRA